MQLCICSSLEKKLNIRIYYDKKDKYFYINVYIH